MYKTLGSEHGVHTSSLDADVFQLGASSPSWRWRSCSSWRGFFAPVLISLLSSFHSAIRLHHSMYTFTFKSIEFWEIWVILWKHIFLGWDELWQWTNWFGVATWKCQIHLMLKLFQVPQFHWTQLNIPLKKPERAKTVQFKCKCGSKWGFSYQPMASYRPVAFTEPACA